MLCLKMIARGEMAHLDRCLTVVTDYIPCWVVGDTGATDFAGSVCPWGER